MTIATRLATATIRAADLPLNLVRQPIAIAVLTGVEGASYRPVGATLVLGADGAVAGNLSSGCIDADIVIHARRVAETGQGATLRYGAGSPFRDLQLPCGGGLDVLVMPLPDPGVIAALRTQIAARQAVTLYAAALGPSLSPQPDALALRVRPDIRFAVFGRGPEAQAFSRMTHAAGYDTVLVTPDAEAAGSEGGLQIAPLHAAPPMDAQTAVVLFFHDHDLEPEILCRALASPAFYIGAQGSRSAAAARLDRLRDMGATPQDCARIRGPIGLIPRTRDPRTLAVSVLAEILAES